MKLIILRTHIRSKPSLAIFIPFSCYLQLRPLSSQIGQRVLDIITPKPNAITNNSQTHLRVIENFLQTNSHQLSQTHQFYPKEQYTVRSSCYVLGSANSKQNSISILFQLHKQGLKIDPCIVSNALSSCAFEKAFCIGTRIHCLAIVNGFVSNVYIGSSLITFYCKCKELSSAYKMFDEMPERNIVSWTAIINGFAQQCQVDMCLKLYQEMRNLALKANDFTYTSFLAACTGSGCIGQGRSVHCQTIQVGFDSYIHVANALISMYFKCGDVRDAMYIFRNLNSKDLVSWNSMIAGYAQHGLAMEAIGLFEEMKENNMKPDGITFLGILSSCRHAGFVKQGRFYFDLMVKYGVKPEVDHYSCIVDLLGRAGLVVEARDFIREMPISPNAVIWGSLLSSSRLRGNVWIGIEAAENRLLLEPWCSATHLQLANLYACVGYWDEAARVRKLMKERGLKTDPGCSWVEIRNGVYQFRAEDRSNCNVLEIISLVDSLVDHMRGVDHVPELFEEEICIKYGK